MSLVVKSESDIEFQDTPQILTTRRYKLKSANVIKFTDTQAVETYVIFKSKRSEVHLSLTPEDAVSLGRALIKAGKELTAHEVMELLADLNQE